MDQHLSNLVDEVLNAAIRDPYSEPLVAERFVPAGHRRPLGTVWQYDGFFGREQINWDLSLYSVR